nr:MAG: helix-turn-helix domain protein [Bacteriophage sp.]
MRKISLKDIRLQIGLKAYKVAENLGISKRQLIRIENGQVKNIDAYKDKLAEIYRISTEEIEKAWEVVKNGQSIK